MSIRNSSDSKLGDLGDCGHIAEQLRPLAVSIESLTPDPANARSHDDRNIDAIKKSLKRFGQRSPIVVQKSGMVVRAGNGRLEAAKQLGWKSIAAVVVDDDNLDAISFAIADNRTAELASWDNSTLTTLLNSLPKESLIDTGFSQSDLDNLLSVVASAPAETDLEFEDAAPERTDNVCPKCGFDLGAAGMTDEDIDT